MMSTLELPVAVERPTPPVPESIADTGLKETFIQQLILKTIYYRGEILGRDLAKSMGLNFSLLEPMLEFFKGQYLVAVKRSLGVGMVSSVFALSDQGRNITLQYIESSAYSGKAPVPLDQYCAVVKLQKRKNWLTPEKLAEAFSHMIVSPDVLAQIGPAVNSGKSFLMYGQPGNGKTYVAESLFRIESDPIFIPYAIESGGQIVEMYDPLYHTQLDAVSDEPSIWAAPEEENYDRRWFRAKRPFIASGGELTLDMLDLAYKPDSKVYDAPLQLKANNGIYLIDDFGRQKVSPTEVLNRWIIPMERGTDFFTFLTGGKISIPFETFLVFSTNLRPHQIGDEAFLRRIQYKMYLRNPVEDEFQSIFFKQCAALDLELDHGALEQFMEYRYRITKKPMRRCQPRDILTHAVDLIEFENLPRLLTTEILDRAYDSTFVADQFEE
ncbi:MAG: ATP-binding protein [Candidatus Solibacter usitatus]|nr:ATP-binding protein [Candidatus Solibacter usitatus]